MIVKVVVHPNSKTRKVEKANDDCLQIYTNNRAIEGKANKEVLEILTEYFKTKKNKIFLISGEKSREKKFELYD